MPRVGIFVLLALATLSPAEKAWSHAMPEHQEPGAGAALAIPPKQVEILFDRALDRASSHVWVETTRGERVDRGDSVVSTSDPKLLSVHLRPLPPGSYHVFWIAVGGDGHTTRGDYAFQVRSLGDAQKGGSEAEIHLNPEPPIPH